MRSPKRLRYCVGSQCRRQQLAKPRHLAPCGQRRRRASRVPLDHAPRASAVQYLHKQVYRTRLNLCFCACAIQFTAFHVKGLYIITNHITASLYLLQLSVNKNLFFQKRNCIGDCMSKFYRTSLNLCFCACAVDICKKGRARGSVATSSQVAIAALFGLVVSQLQMFQSFLFDCVVCLGKSFLPI